MTRAGEIEVYDVSTGARALQRSTDCRTGLMDERSRRRTLSCRAIRLKLVQRALGTFPNTGPEEIPATQRRTRCYQATQPRRVLATNM
jgi:hypothetical protein